MKHFRILVLLGVLIFFLFFSVPTRLRSSGGCIDMARPYTDPPIIFLGLYWKSEIKWLCGYNGFVWGPSALEHLVAFKRSIDSNGFWFLYPRVR